LAARLRAGNSSGKSGLDKFFFAFFINCLP